MAQFNIAKPRAKIRILSHIAQFSFQRYIEDHPLNGSRDMSFQTSGFGTKAEPGDLVSLSSAPASKWYLSWYVERNRPEGYCDDVHVLESIEDGELCNWTNVSMDHYDRSQVAAHPEWRWTDRQFEFNARWRKVTNDNEDGYIYRGLQVQFTGDDASFGISTKWNFGERPEPVPIMLPKWKKITKAQMLEVYLRLVEAAKLRDKKKESA